MFFILNAGVTHVQIDLEYILYIIIEKTTIIILKFKYDFVFLKNPAF